jgi:hypothetical protein
MVFPSQRQKRLANADLVAAIHSFLRSHNAVTKEDASANTVIQGLRDRGQDAHAAELETVVQRIRARRAGR